MSKFMLAAASALAIAAAPAHAQLLGNIGGTVNGALNGTIAGSLNGAQNPDRDLHDIVRLALDGAFDLASQVTQVWPLDEIDDAIAAVRRGDVVRAVLDHSLGGRS